MLGFFGMHLSAHGLIVTPHAQPFTVAASNRGHVSMQMSFFDREPAVVAGATTEATKGVVTPTGASLPDRTRVTDKEKVVVLGSGWASVKFIQNIDTDVFDVTVVSPRNFFLFSPFLPSVTVGSVEGRSIVEPIRSLVQYQARPLTRKLKDRLKGRDGLTEEGFEPSRFLEVACTKIDAESNRIYCEDVSSLAGDSPGFTLAYDRLVVAVGAVSNTFNTPGVNENALFLKEIDDATVIRSRMLDAFETASLEEDEAKMK